MLPASARLRSSDDFRQTVRTGVRTGRPTLVVHARHTGVDATRVGFVVSRAVGGAVTRNRVKRRLRHMAAGLLTGTPTGVQVVVRALPAAASEPGRLAGDLTDSWTGVLRKLDRGARS